MRAITASACTLALALWAGAQVHAGEEPSEHEEAVALDEEGREIAPRTEEHETARDNAPKPVRRIEAKARGTQSNGAQESYGEEETVSLDESGRAQAAPKGPESAQAKGEADEAAATQERRTQAGAGEEEATRQAHGEEQEKDALGAGEKEGQAQAERTGADSKEAQTETAHSEAQPRAEDNGGKEQAEEEGDGNAVQVAAEAAQDAEHTQGKCSLAKVSEREARRGERLIATVSRWGEEGGWTIVAKTKYDWPIEAGHRSVQRLDEAILELTEGFKRVQPAPKATAYGKNCVIVIRDNATRSG